MAVRAEEPSGMAQATAHSNSTSTQTTALLINTSEYELRCDLHSRSQLTLAYCMPGLQPEDQTKVQWNSAGQRGWHLTPPYRGALKNLSLRASEESASHLLSRFQCSGFAPHLRNKSLVLQRFQINVNIRQRTLDCCPCQGRRCCQI